jgi:hypothetical protein
METFNADKRSAQMLDFVKHMSVHYTNNHLFVPFGGDFAYANAL